MTFYYFFWKKRLKNKIFTAQKQKNATILSSKGYNFATFFKTNIFFLLNHLKLFQILIKFLYFYLF